VNLDGMGSGQFFITEIFIADVRSDKSDRAKNVAVFISQDMAMPLFLC